MPQPEQSVRAPAPKFEVQLPAGGAITVETAEEKTYFEDLSEQYQADYRLVKTNDLVLLGAILMQSLQMFRAMKDTGDPKKANRAVGEISKASEQIRELEKALGIDKKTREAGGQHNIIDYLTNLKRFAHERAVRIADRVKAFEDFNKELEWRIRVLRNGDEEDRRVHGITPASIIDFAEKGLASIAADDKKWAEQVGKLYVGTT